MGKEVKEVTLEELFKLIQSQRGEFMIHVEPGEEDQHGDKNPLSA